MHKLNHYYYLKYHTYSSPHKKPSKHPNCLIRTPLKLTSSLKSWLTSSTSFRKAPGSRVLFLWFGSKAANYHTFLHSLLPSSAENDPLFFAALLLFLCEGPPTRPRRNWPLLKGSAFMHTVSEPGPLLLVIFFWGDYLRWWFRVWFRDLSQLASRHRSLEDDFSENWPQTKFKLIWTMTWGNIVACDFWPLKALKFVPVPRRFDKV